MGDIRGRLTTCSFCHGIGLRARCTCCKADEVRIIDTTLCRECDIDCRGEHPCERDMPAGALLAVAGTL